MESSIVIVLLCCFSVVCPISAAISSYIILKKVKEQAANINEYLLKTRDAAILEIKKVDEAISAFDDKIDKLNVKYNIKPDMVREFKSEVYCNDDNEEQHHATDVLGAKVAEFTAKGYDILDSRITVNNGIAEGHAHVVYIKYLVNN